MLIFYWFSVVEKNIENISQKKLTKINQINNHT